MIENNTWIQRTASHTAVIFVHGILSDSDGCWRNSYAQSGQMMKTVVALALLGLICSVPAEAACMRDRWGQTICGAGPCMRDREGEVYCAPTRYGSVVRSLYGQARCAPGQCVRTFQGDDICSDVDGGGVAKQMDGTVRCQGACIYATPEQCQYDQAGR